MTDSSAQPKASRSPSSYHLPARIALLLTAVILLLLWPMAREHLRALELLARMSSQRQNRLTRFDQHLYDQQPLSFSTSQGNIKARLYVPRDVQHPPAMVVVHGLHRLGIAEPRLTTFAKALAETGVVVLTPELEGIADYRVEPRSIAIIGESAQELARRSHLSKVGVLGISFAGGLSLMAAADRRFADQISFVAAVGAPDDVLRVEHYLVEGSTEWPDGKPLTVPPHEYGWLILIYSHPEDFFPLGDVEGARNSLRLLLHEDVDGARRQSQQLSPEGRRLFDAIFQHQRDPFRDKLRWALEKHRDESISVSPHNHLAGLRAKVLLIHGEGDTVIPPSETEWLARDLPRGKVQDALISPAISHVSLKREPGWRDQLAVVHWIALMLDDADRETPSTLALSSRSR